MCNLANHSSGAGAPRNGLVVRQFLLLIAHGGGWWVGLVGAVGVQDGGDDAVAVVDGFDPGVDIVGVVALDVDKLVWGFGAVQVLDELGAERAPVGVEDGDVSGGFGGLYSH